MGKLAQTLPRPGHLEGRAREELSEAESKELAEWERAAKALAEEQEQYRKALEVRSRAGDCIYYMTLLLCTLFLRYIDDIFITILCFLGAGRGA